MGGAGRVRAAGARTGRTDLLQLHLCSCQVLLQLVPLCKQLLLPGFPALWSACSAQLMRYSSYDVARCTCDSCSHKKRMFHCLCIAVRQKIEEALIVQAACSASKCVQQKSAS